MSQGGYYKVKEREKRFTQQKELYNYANLYCRMYVEMDFISVGPERRKQDFRLGRIITVWAHLLARLVSVNSLEQLGVSLVDCCTGLIAALVDRCIW